MTRRRHDDTLTWKTARVSHVCSICWAPIEPGQRFATRARWHKTANGPRIITKCTLCAPEPKGADK